MQTSEEKLFKRCLQVMTKTDHDNDPNKPLPLSTMIRQKRSNKFGIKVNKFAKNPIIVSDYADKIIDLKPLRERL